MFLLGCKGPVVSIDFLDDVWYNGSMEIESWLKEAKKQVAGLDAELIALDCFAPKGADRSWLVSNNVVKITTEMQQKAQAMIKRRGKGEPLAYILRKKEFYGRDFLVDQRVLVPRPETESLIEIVKALNLPRQPRFLEVGTGSGCLAITLALEFPQSYVLASDISAKALEVATENDLRHEGRVDFVQSNLLSEIQFETGGEYFDVLVANLPYVSHNWQWVKVDNLRFEPKSAIYARGKDGLALYRRFFAELNERERLGELWANYVVVEADPCQHLALVEIGEKSGLKLQKIEGFGLLFENLNKLVDVEAWLAEANY